MKSEESTNRRPVPEWFTFSERATPETMKRVAAALQSVSLPIQINFLPSEAFWFLLNALQIANQANREGKHANALSVTRQCIEAISIIELGLSAQTGAVQLLFQWEKDKKTSGELRIWLEKMLGHIMVMVCGTRVGLVSWGVLRGRFSPMHIILRDWLNGNQKPILLNRTKTVA